MGSLFTKALTLNIIMLNLVHSETVYLVLNIVQCYIFALNRQKTLKVLKVS